MEGFFQILEQEDDSVFFRNLRMTKETFNFIKDAVKFHHQKSTKSCHDPLTISYLANHSTYRELAKTYITCSETLILTISYLANHSTYRELANTYGLSNGCVHKTVINMINILDEIAPNFIRWPTKEEAIEDEKEF